MAPRVPSLQMEQPQPPPGSPFLPLPSPQDHIHFPRTSSESKTIFSHMTVQRLFILLSKKQVAKVRFDHSKNV